MFSKRSGELEYLDLGPGYYDSGEYEDCMRKLAKIGRYLGGNTASMKALDRLNFMPESVLDVGCGGGEFSRLLALKYHNAKVVGIDTSQDAVKFAKEHSRSRDYPNLSFEHRANPNLGELNLSYDIVIATLLCHHMQDSQIVEFLKDACSIAKRAVIINDLHRHPLAYLSFALIAPVFFNNRLILHDGKLSVKRAFIRKDWVKYLSQANLQNQWEISWNWAFRWIVTIKK
jgi:2-polyprenyl-3-methyl-5-hydroxy-6-metoxy-1,4-benzoquinol methylase